MRNTLNYSQNWLRESLTIISFFFLPDLCHFEITLFTKAIYQINIKHLETRASFEDYTMDVKVGNFIRRLLGYVRLF